MGVNKADRAHSFSALDREMLSAARALVDQTPSVFEIAVSNVLVVVDTRDAIGAEFLVSTYQVSGMTRVAADSLVDAMLRESERSKGVHLPLAAFWVHVDALFAVMTAWDAPLPPEADQIRSPPAPGFVWTFLRRDSGSVLASIDFATLKPHRGNHMLVGKRKKRGRPS